MKKCYLRKNELCVKVWKSRLKINSTWKLFDSFIERPLSLFANKFFKTLEDKIIFSYKINIWPTVRNFQTSNRTYIRSRDHKHGVLRLPYAARLCQVTTMLQLPSTFALTLHKDTLIYVVVLWVWTTRCASSRISSSVSSVVLSSVVTSSSSSASTSKLEPRSPTSTPSSSFSFRLQ